MQKQLLTILIFFMIVTPINAQKADKDYFGLTPPKGTPEIFAPGFICLEDRIEGRGTFSPDGNQFFFTVSDEYFTKQKIFYSEFSRNGWSLPDTASFSKKEFACWEPYFSYDSNKIYFTGNIELEPDPKSKGQDFYFTQKDGDTWTQPQKLTEPINSNNTELFISKLENGNIYFTSDRPGGRGVFNIYIAQKQDNGQYRVRDLGLPINKGVYNYDPCISSDESFMIIAADRRYRKKRKADLLISYNRGDKWSRPVGLGHKINTNANEYGAFLSNDNNYLYFVRLGDGNQGDIYWIDLKTILNKKIIKK